MKDATSGSTETVQIVVEQVTAALVGRLGENLKSLILYGSAVREETVRPGSDINLLVVLEDSTAAAHRVIRDTIQKFPHINPFIVEQPGMSRATRVFALKFLSIRRSHRLLHGVDVLNSLSVSRELEVLLAEQELRNLRMRLVHQFVTSDPSSGRYQRFVVRNAGRFVIVLSDVLRCADINPPKPLADRLPLFEKEFGADPGVLQRLLALKSSPRELNRAELEDAHAGLVTLFRRVLIWMARRWPDLPL